MAWGIDTAAPLNDSCFDWANFKGWRGTWPTFVARYFSGPYSATAGEFKAFKSTTGGTCNYVLPICSPGQDRIATKGSTGHSYGVTDAQTVVNNINAFLNSGELLTPSGGDVYVYLDVEYGTVMSPAYWAGWSNEVFSNSVFFPAVYCPFAENASGVYVPADGTTGGNPTNVTTALNTACEYYTGATVNCFGFWSSEPEPYANCSQGVNPSWPDFETFVQNLCNGVSTSVPVLVWQYAENSPCLAAGHSTFGGTCSDSCPDFSSYEKNGQTEYSQTNNIDVDSTDSSGGESYMMNIQNIS